LTERGEKALTFGRVTSDMNDLPAVALRWREGLFAHWPVDPSRVRPLVPDPLDVDTREETAWVSALPSLVEAGRPWFLPAEFGMTFPQVNLRTYVRYDGEPGVYFLSLDADTPLGVRVARAIYGLPYHDADIDFQRGPDTGEEAVGGSEDGGTYRFDCQRVHTDERPARFAAEYCPTGRPSHADPDSLDAFLAERYRLYLVRNGTVHCARVEHDPWRLCPAEARVHADALLESVGLPAPAEEPMVRYAPGASFTIRTPFRP
jgi:hypothetical protein